MQITLAHIGPRSSKSGPKSQFESLTRLYLDRLSPCFPCLSQSFPSESDFLAWLTRQHSRLPAFPVLLDSRGRQLSSPEFAAWLGARRDQGVQHLVFAVGPADGWSPSTIALASKPAPGQPQLLLSFGPITLPHELARLVLAEQLYRACTILSGHPYHSGH
jgi:23S rRNA (pseudouridine1915-N3)-methyltransferase